MWTGKCTESCFPLAHIFPSVARGCPDGAPGRGEEEREGGGAPGDIATQGPPRGYLGGGGSWRAIIACHRERNETTFCPPPASGGFSRSAVLPGTTRGCGGSRTHPSLRSEGCVALRRTRPSCAPQPPRSWRSFSNVSPETLQRVLPNPSSDLVATEPRGLYGVSSQASAAHDPGLRQPGPPVFREGGLASSIQGSFHVLLNMSRDFYSRVILSVAAGPWRQCERRRQSADTRRPGKSDITGV